MIREIREEKKQTAYTDKVNNREFSYNHLFPSKISNEWSEVIPLLDRISEIKIRVNRPIFIILDGRERIIGIDGKLREQDEGARIITVEEMKTLIDHWCQNSRYAFEDQIKQGFLTLKNGHRIGICGETVMDENKCIQRIKNISSVNIRIAHEKKGIAKKILPYVYEGKRIKNILIISPPGAGKTTVLRDLVRMISDGNSLMQGQSVALIDERKEIAACYQGIPQLDIGRRTDVMDSCSKGKGMKIVLRSMTPSVIAVDEIGDREEISLLEEISKSGCSVIATIHGFSYEEIKKKKKLNKLFQNNYFEIALELSREEDNFHAMVYEKGRVDPCFVY